MSIGLYDSNRRYVQAFIEKIWNEKNIEICSRYIGSTYNIRHDPGDPWEGRTLNIQMYKERLSYYLAAFPDQQFTIKDLVAEHDSITCCWHWKGTHLGLFAGYQPTHQVITTSGITNFYIWNASLCGHWQVVDRLSLKEQLEGACENHNI